MPLFIDIHRHIEGLTSEGIAHAHAADLGTQAKYGVNILQYWYDEKDGQVFCLIEAPSKNAQRAICGVSTLSRFTQLPRTVAVMILATAGTTDVVISLFAVVVTDPEIAVQVIQRSPAFPAGVRRRWQQRVASRVGVRAVVHLPSGSENATCVLQQLRRQDRFDEHDVRADAIRTLDCGGPRVGRENDDWHCRRRRLPPELTA
jgi:hypothetical protein